MDISGLRYTSTINATPYRNFDKVFKVNILTRSEWDMRNLIEKYNVRLYPEGSKMSCGVRTGIFSDHLSIGPLFLLLGVN